MLKFHELCLANAPVDAIKSCIEVNNIKPDEVLGHEVNVFDRACARSESDLIEYLVDYCSLSREYLLEE